MKKYILLVSGPLCSGKTTLVETFLKKEERLFRVSFDTVKRLVSDFDSEKDRHMVKEFIFALSQKVTAEKLSLCIEGSASLFEEFRAFYKDLAKTHGYTFFEVNLEAPLEILKQRLDARIQAGKALVVKDHEQFMRRYDLYTKHKDASAPTFDTSKLSSEEIYVMIRNTLPDTLV